MKLHDCERSYHNIVPETGLRATFNLFIALIAAGEISCEIHEGIGLEGKEIDGDDEEPSTS